MTDQIVRLGPEYFPRPTSGIPVSGGSIYIGEPDLDPEIVGNQITVNALQENGSTVPISQPILTGGGGVPLYNGSPVTLLVSESYSMKVLDAFDVQVYYVPSIVVETDVNSSTVDYVKDLIGLINISSPVDDETHTVLSYFDSLNKGGGQFYWDLTINKNTANGGTIIDPDNIGGFDGTTGTLNAFLVAQGTGVGFGCWIRQEVGSGANVEEFGATGDGVTDDTSAIQATDVVGDFIIPSGTYKISSNTTIASNVTFLPGTVLIPDNAITVTFTGTVIAGQYMIFGFSAGGDFALNEAGYKYNISHFSGTSFNDKWDNLRTNLVDGNHYTLLVPIPKKDEVGAVEQGTGRWHWIVDGEIIIDTKENNGHWFTYGQFFITAAITNCFKFGLTTKTEDIDFPLPLWVNVDTGGSGSCTNAVVLHGISRLTMPLLTVNNCDTALKIDPINAVSFIDIDNIQAGNNCRALHIEVTASSATNMSFQTVQSEVHGSVTGTVVTLTGPMRNLLIDRIVYNKNTGVKITNAVVIENNSFGRLNFSNRINEVYANSAVTGVRIKDTTSGAGAKTDGIHIGFIGVQGTDTVLDADYCIDVTLVDWFSGQTVTIGSLAERVRLSPLRGQTSDITDTGDNAIINGHGNEAAGAGLPPDTANWEIGETVTNTSDNDLWLKWRDIGVSASDLRQIG